MSIPPISAITAAVNAAKASSAFAAGMADGVSEKMGEFADAFAGGESTAQEPSTASDAAAGSSGESSSGSPSILEMLAELQEQLGISFEGPIELRIDGHDQVNVTIEHGFTDRDFESRMKLQSHINGNDSIRTEVARAIRSGAGGVIVMSGPAIGSHERQ